jgi:YidC/Oxa1 family membrane protein insertase
MNPNQDQIKQTKKMLLISAVCVGIIMLWGNFFGQTAETQSTTNQKETQESEAAKADSDKQDSEKTSITLADANKNRGANVWVFENEKIKGSINLEGFKIDNLVLKNYKVEGSDEMVQLLKPAESDEYYNFELGFKGEDKKSVPSDKTIWRKVDEKDGFTIFTANVENNEFKISIKFDENYLWNIKLSSSKPDEFSGFVKLKRNIEKLKDKNSYSHTGIAMVNKGILDEIKYKNIEKNKFITEEKAWIGFGDVYWFSGIVLGGKNESEISYLKSKKCDQCYQIQASSTENGDFRFMIFTGAKDQKLISKYQQEYSIPSFDKVVDFGWFYFLTKPISRLLDVLYIFFSNFGVAIIALTVIVRAILFPLAQKSYKSTQKIKDIAPEIERTRELYADRPKREFNMAVVAIYKEHKVNPAAGCLPLVLQIPVFFALYKVLVVSLSMRDAGFILWIKDLSDPDPTSIFNLFGLLPFETSGIFQLGVLPLILGGSMLLQQKFSPTPTDPTQAKMMKLMPIVFTFVFAGFPSGLVVYWITNNMLGILQQYIISLTSKKKLFN